MTRHLLVLDSGQIGPGEPISAVLGPDREPLGVVTVVDPLDLNWPPEGPPSPRQRASEHAGGLTDFDGVIVAHCTNAALALELAALVAPECVVLFAPVRVTTAMVGEHTERLLVALGEPEASAARFARQVWHDGGPVDVALRGSFDRLRALARADASGFDMDEWEAERFVSILCGRYEQWLGHLVGQVGVEVTDPTCPVHVLGDRTAADLLPTGPVRRYDHADPYAFGTPGLQHLFREVLAVSTTGRPS
jgi:hypothetical protein